MNQVFNCMCFLTSKKFVDSNGNGERMSSFTHRVKCLLRTSKNTFVSLSVTPSVSTIVRPLVRLLALVFQYWGLELSCFKIQKIIYFCNQLCERRRRRLAGAFCNRELSLRLDQLLCLLHRLHPFLWHQPPPTKSPNTKNYIAINFAKSCLAASTSTSLRLAQLLSHHHRLRPFL